ncbi:aminoglycoside phosphotransferase [Tsuneonella deserti]|uniref:Aminoglycoside phosphotransferase n=1 Tax=Tsuneonella deserti TaxID=2035528 RepID=A0ABQ1S8A1_9SPHN|nr:phosphotransferase [Tsuneonella deserti]GGD94638.1 aminoglycoside phosphotransferase [Tsuneonella deserti]
MSDLPEGLRPFLASAGWEGAGIDPIPGDASFRRYFRVRDGGRNAMLMHAPPPNEDPRPFLDVAAWLSRNGMRAPEIYSADAGAGWVLLEDFGNDRMRDWLDVHPEDEDSAYAAAIDALVALHARAPGPFPPYDLAAYRREVEVFTEWYCPAAGIEADSESYWRAWEEALAPLLDRQVPGVTVLRDYHAENIMLLPGGAQGLIDFQDALAGHRAYDLVSLLQDARREVSLDLEKRMLARYVSQVDGGPDFAADYARLGAQRNAKIVGVFTRLWKRDGKPAYLPLIPRVWEALERDLAHPALAPVAAWFDANIPPAVRQKLGGTLG